MRHKKPYKKSVYQSLVLLSQFGINMVVPIAMCCAVGIWLDNRFHTAWITIVLFFIGAIAGGQNIYRLVKKMDGKDKESDKASDQTEIRK